MTREEVNQTLNELCQYGGMMLDWRYIEAIKIAAIFYETGEDTATNKKCATCGQPRNDTGHCILFKEGECVDNYEKWIPVTKEGNEECT